MKDSTKDVLFWAWAWLLGGLTLGMFMYYVNEDNTRAYELAKSQSFRCVEVITPSEGGL